MNTLIHPLSDIQSSHIGGGTRIRQYCVVMPDAKIGTECDIGSSVFIENDVVVGDRVTIQCGVQLWDGARISNDVFIGPNVTFTNNLMPRSRELLKTVIHQGAVIGANATILPGLTIGRHSLIGAGAVVTRDVPAHAIVRGNPGRITGYTHETVSASHSEAVEFIGEPMMGVSFIHLTAASDLRGDLLAVELARQVPFPVQRVFHVMNVPSHHIRGEHAHRQCHQLLVCLQGSITIGADNGTERKEWVLDRPDIGIPLHPMVWGIQYRYTKNAVLAVFASHAYDPQEYIRDYEEFTQSF